MAAWAASAVAVPASTAAAASRAAWAAASAACGGGSRRRPRRRLITGRGCGGGRIGGSRGRGFRGGGRVGGVLRLGRLGGQGGGRIGGAGRLRGGVGGFAGGGGGFAGGGGRVGRGVCRPGRDRSCGLGFGGARIPGGDRRGGGLFRGRGGPFGRHGPGVGLVVVAAADQRKAGRSNASLRAGSQHGATRDLSLSQGGPMVQGGSSTKFLSGTRLSLCGTARCVSFHSIDRGGGGLVFFGKLLVKSSYLPIDIAFYVAWGGGKLTPEPPPVPPLQRFRWRGGEVPAVARGGVYPAIPCTASPRWARITGQQGAQR